MDVSVLGDPPAPVDHDKHEVAKAVNVTIDDVIQSGDENTAMQLMAKGASALTRALFEQGEFDGMIAMGGTMGTDLALDCARALPLGVPKYIILHSSILTVDSSRASSRRYSDDSLGGRTLWTQFSLQIIPKPGRWSRAWSCTCGRTTGT